MIVKSQRVKITPRKREPKLIVSSTFKRLLRGARPPLLEDEITEHIESMRLCFPEWHGPKVAAGSDGLCEIQGYCTGGRFLGAKVCITRVDGYLIEGVIAYEPCDPEHCLSNNGIPLRLHITDIWPPVWILNP